MAISDIALTQPTSAIKGPSCSVCQQLGTLPESEAEALLGLLKNPRWRYQELSDALAKEGIDIASYSLSRHARGQCLARNKLRGVA